MISLFAGPANAPAARGALQKMLHCAMCRSCSSIVALSEFGSVWICLVNSRYSDIRIHFGSSRLTPHYGQIAARDTDLQRGAFKMKSQCHQWWLLWCFVIMVVWQVRRKCEAGPSAPVPRMVRWWLVMLASLVALAQSGKFPKHQAKAKARWAAMGWCRWMLHQCGRGQMLCGVSAGKSKTENITGVNGIRRMGRKNGWRTSHLFRCHQWWLVTMGRRLAGRWIRWTLGAVLVSPMVAVVMRGHYGGMAGRKSVDLES
eukprot:s1168_g9.t1